MSNSADVYELALALHAAATLALAGLIWFVQIVHYPMFIRIGAADLARCEREHQIRTTYVVAPLMIAELVSAIGVVLMTDAGLASGAGSGPAWFGLALVAMIWLWTFAVMVPVHRRLERVAGEADQARSVVRRLVRLNAVRTIAWSVRGLIALWLMARAPG